jgi:hypothetical protein
MIAEIPFMYAPFAPVVKWVAGPADPTSLQGFPGGRKGPPDVDDAKGMLDQLESALADLKHQYDLFFTGKRRGEPMRERKDLETKLLVLSRRSVVNNTDQLRFNNLSGRYWAFANLWTRTMRDLEEGRLRRDSAGSVSRAVAGPSVPVDREHLERVAAELISARRSCGLGGDESEAPALRDSLYARALEISSSAGGKKVEFRVAVEDGKPKIKAVLR